MWEKISRLSFSETIDWILNNSGVVMCCTLNEVLMYETDLKIKAAIDRAALITPDGMPLVWSLKMRYGKGERVYGPDILKALLDKRKKSKERSVGMLFIGDDNNKSFFEKYGDYVVMPFKTEFEKKDYKMVASKIKKSRCHVVWVGLGARKQVMAADELYKMVPDKVYVTVGAAFDFISGNKKQSPKVLRVLGLEWLYRAMAEPKRLGWRYFQIILYFARKLVRRIYFFN